MSFIYLVIYVGLEWSRHKYRSQAGVVGEGQGAVLVLPEEARGQQRDGRCDQARSRPAESGAAEQRGNTRQ